MNKLLLSICIFSFYASAQANSPFDDALYEDFLIDTEIPEVLTATRLKQPKAETPASMTVIEAAQLEAWGVRSISEALRFVPGMNVGHSRSESSDVVVYHASVSSSARRLQVLVDGRSIYKAAVSQVIWSDIPVAIEDIKRIEVIRGPSSATYGANAFMATINIITKSPEESLGSRVSQRSGSNGVQDTYLSHAGAGTLGRYRITASYTQDDGFDGAKARDSHDEWQDSKRNKFVNLNYQQQLSEHSSITLYAGLGNSYADIDHDDLNGSQFRDTDYGYLHSKLTFNFSDTHQAQLQAYYRQENRNHERYDTVPTVYFDPNLGQLYNRRPETTWRLIERILRNPNITKEDITGSELYQSFNAAEQVLADQVINQNLNELVSGYIDYDISEQRVDVEWQDNIVWHPRFRTVSGLSLRQDKAYSRPLFDGRRKNNIYRTFLNAEWRALDQLLFNAGGMYEYETLNRAAFSPRLGINWLLNGQQSVRLLYSQAVRSPDMLEQQPHIQLRSHNMSPNYLGVTEANFFRANIADRDLQHEQIKSYELGYYLLLNEFNLELDIKLYRDYLSQLISSPINLDNPELIIGTELTIGGIEAQAKWQPSTNHWLWLTLSHTDIDVTPAAGYTNEETFLSPESSATTSWYYSMNNGFSSTLSYIWADSLSNGNNLYQRSEVVLKKQWKLPGMQPWISTFWQHQFSNAALGYDYQRNATRNLYYLQFGVNF